MRIIRPKKIITDLGGIGMAGLMTVAAAGEYHDVLAELANGITETRGGGVVMLERADLHGLIKMTFAEASTGSSATATFSAYPLDLDGLDFTKF